MKILKSELKKLIKEVIQENKVFVKNKKSDSKSDSGYWIDSKSYDSSKHQKVKTIAKQPRD